MLIILLPILLMLFIIALFTKLVRLSFISIMGVLFASWLMVFAGGHP